MYLDSEYSVLQSARADGDGMRRPSGHESGEGGGDESVFELIYYS